MCQDALKRLSPRFVVTEDGVVNSRLCLNLSGSSEALVPNAQFSGSEVGAGEGPSVIY